MKTSVVWAPGRNLSSNAISGSLPSNWGWADTFPLLEVLTLDGNRLTGSLPPGYGTPGAFKALLVLNLDHNRLWGARPRVPLLRPKPYRETLAPKTLTSSRLPATACPAPSRRCLCSTWTTTGSGVRAPWSAAL